MAIPTPTLVIPYPRVCVVAACKYITKTNNCFNSLRTSVTTLAIKRDTKHEDIIEFH